jgi:hypothetical protein
MAAKTGIAVGLNKGHVTTKRELPQRASRRKGVGLPSYCAQIWS